MIEFHQVSVLQGTKRLYNVSLTFHQCDFNVIAMLDTNTLEAVQSLLSCQMYPTSGEILIDGQPYDRSRSIISVSSGRNFLIESFSIGQNLYGLNSGVFFNEKKIEQKCNALIHRFGFHLKADCLIAQLNWEHREIVELLRAYVKQPKVLVLSEPFDSLSLENLLHVKNLLVDMRARGTYIILLTRKYDDVFKLGDSISVLRNGHLIESFSDDEIFREPQRFYEAFLGGSSIFADEQFALSDGDFDALDIVRIGTQCMFSHENVSDSFQKYACLTEQYFSDARCAIYIQNLGTQKRMKPYFGSQYTAEQVPLTGDAALQHILSLNEPLNMIPFDASIHSTVADFPYTSILYKTIKRNEECGGIFQIAFLKPYSVTKSDVDYLQTVSDEIFLILDNCRLAGNSSYLQEMHHRIKNNLQLVTSMLMLEKNHYKMSGRSSYRAEDIEQLIDTTIARIQGMATIHNLLTRSTVLNDMVTTQSVLDELHRFYRELIEIHVENLLDAPISQSMASSFALVMNELINNSIKHNQGKEHLSCNISIMKKDGLVEIQYRDNGVGFPDENIAKGVGMTIMEATVRTEYWGSIRTYNDNGACTVLTFSDEALYESNHETY
ncbi:Histidine kinase-, DNA gyrase B-, and HSP90-like ATPase [Oscillibacter sp. PC13]|uniref:histidine kinase dimerization/phosphoacceptor domain -containing protein n=1 Tax=Oscillibacter sp. PC13 TaxID=1855299 RepID=UPI0008E63797|nr:histidine kinase dimerization/phosphoacceptor domain -containing protein [Oscillibacter sp. PC13]SFP99854.1 Histidine kinase-, DNA gyrase B-, and HSP90-like ATPase [Oscillibacter sp. PC13]